MKTLLKYSKNKYSQNGEDGILAEIFRRLSIKKGWFVEFGAWDAKHMSNSYALLEKGWSGVDIEGDGERYKDLVKAASKFSGRLHTIKAFVGNKGKNSLDSLLGTTPITKDFELLSVDIDSYDYYIWQTLKKYNPKVVVIEINSGIALGKEYVQPYGIPYEKLLAVGKLSGTSFSSMLKLGQDKGYSLVAHTGNMIFVRSDLVDKLKLPSDELKNPGGLFMTDWVTKSSPIDSLKQLFKRWFSAGN